MRDVVVVGGGPAGLRLAGGLASAGLDVVLFDERRRIGEKKICTGIIGAEAFRELGLPRESILNRIQRLKFLSPKGREVDYTHPTLLAHVVDRTRFDRSLADLAEAGGARLRSGVSVREVRRRRQSVSVEVRSEEGTEQVRARVLVLATGVNFRLNRAVGLGVPVDFLNAAQAHLPVRGLDCTHCFAGREVAPGAFGWLVPLGDGLARLGLMAEGPAAARFRSLADRIAPYRVDPEQPLEADFKPIAQRFEGRSYGERVLAVGEAAGQVKTTTGGGIYYGLLGAQAAVDCLLDAFKADRFDAPYLSRYEDLWKRRIAGELETGYRYRKLFARLSDRKIEALFLLAQHNGVIPLVRRHAAFDWHSDVLDSVSRHGIIPKLLGI